jgi:hypothetical protein
MDGLAAADTTTITIALVSDVAAAGEEEVEVEAQIITAVVGVIPALGVSSTEAGPVVEVEAAVGVVGVATFSATAIPNDSTLLSIFL